MRAGRRDSAAGAYQPTHEYVSETPGSNRRSVSSPCRQIRRLDRQRARRTSGVRWRLLSNLRIFVRKPTFAKSLCSDVVYRPVLNKRNTVTKKFSLRKSCIYLSIMNSYTRYTWKNEKNSLTKQKKEKKQYRLFHKQADIQITNSRRASAIKPMSTGAPRSNGKLIGSLNLSLYMQLNVLFIILILACLFVYVYVCMLFLFKMLLPCWRIKIKDLQFESKK